MRVLLTAFTCSPSLGSEPGVGWEWAKAAAVGNDCTLVVHSSSVDEVRAAFRKQPELTMEVVGLSDPLWLTALGSRFVRVGHVVWQSRAGRLAERLHADQPFDVMHHLTLSSDWQPAGLARVEGPAFVWGPVGGGTPTPSVMLRWLGVRGAISEVARRFASGLGRRRYGDLAAARAAVILCQNSEVAARFGRGRKAQIQPNVALGEAWFDKAGVGAEDYFSVPTTKTACFVGRLLAWKGLSLALAVLAHPMAADWSLLIIGTGPDDRRLMKLVEKHGLSERVRFTGNLHRDQVRAVFQQADAMLFPSLHEGAGWAVAEAMAAGCPVIALDHAGPASLVPPGSGTLVPSSWGCVTTFAAALQQTTSRIDPLHRWDAARLPDVLNGIYAQAVASHKLEGVGS